MSHLLSAVSEGRDRRDTAEADFREALRRAHEQHSWQQIAEAAGLTKQGVIYLALNKNARRKARA